MATLRSLIVSAATPEEADSIYQFYTRHSDANVLPRPESDIRTSVEKGLFFKATAGAELLAVSGVFDLGDVQYVELGGTLVESRIRGFGLQRLLFQLRIASVVVNEEISVQMLTAVNPSNLISCSNALAAGFIVWSDPIEDVFVACRTCPKHEHAGLESRLCCCDFFILPTSRAQREVQRLLSTMDESGQVTLLNSKAKTLQTQIRSRLLLPAYRLTLQEFAFGAA